MHRWSRRLPSRIVVVVVLVLSAIAQFLPQGAEAAGNLTSSFIRIDRMKVNTATGGMVCAKPATTATEAKVLITFPSTYTLNTTASNWTVTTTNLYPGSTIWPGIGTATTVSNAAHTALFPSNDLAVGTLYCFNFAAVNTLTTAAAAANSQQASIETQDSGGTPIDDGFIALANNTDDTIVITAVVPPSFIFTLSGYTDTFAANLDPLSVVSTAGVTATVTTNAKGGWIAWAKDLFQGLHSTAATYTIPTAGTVGDAASTQLTPGTEGYVMDSIMTTDAAGGCTVGIDADYDGTSQAQPTRSGGTLASTYQRIASCTGAAPATANGDVITMTERAAISGVTPAGTDYTDSITVVGAGNF
jgi:hypothetical protein